MREHEVSLLWLEGLEVNQAKFMCDDLSHVVRLDGELVVDVGCLGGVPTEHLLDQGVGLPCDLFDFFDSADLDFRRVDGSPVGLEALD